MTRTTGVVQGGDLSLAPAAAELRADLEIVLEARNQNWRALVCAAADLRADRQIVLEAAKQSLQAVALAAM